MSLNVLKIFLPTVMAFFAGISLTPFLTHYLYKHRMWKKKAGKISPDGKETIIFNQLHKNKEVGTPRMGGIIIWSSTLVTIFFFWIIYQLWPTPLTEKFNFLSRNQTWLPLFTLISASTIGLIDDWLQLKEYKDKVANGLAFKVRLLAVALIGLVGGWWFFSKLGIDFIYLPLYGNWVIGFWIIPIFIAVVISLFSSGVIDGLDGLAGGIMAIIFTAYAGIAFFQNRIDLAAFCAVLAGATLAFLWFNIPPARFYMSETGMLGLTVTLAVIAFLTDSILFLPLIALPLLATSLSVVIQLASKKIRGRKVFLVAPLHHHFEAIGWPAYKVVMRYWIIGIVCSIIGMILVLLAR